MNLETTPRVEPVRTRNVAKAGAWGFSGRAVLLFANLIATPFTIRLLGPSEYGLWVLVQTIITWAALADIGLSIASTKFAADQVERRNARGESSVLWSCLAMLSPSVVTVAVVIFVAAPDIADHLVRANSPLLHSAIWALRLASGIIVVQAVAGVITTPQQVRLRWGSFTIINVTTNIAAIIGIPVALAASGGGVRTAALVALVAAAASLIWNFFISGRLQPAILRPGVSRRVMRQVFSYGSALALAGLAGVILSTAERYFLAGSRSATVLGYYAVASTLATTVLVFPEQVTAPLGPSFARLEASQRWDDRDALYKLTIKVLVLALTPSAILLSLIAHPFLALWAGPQYGRYSTLPFLVAIVGVWFNALAWVPYSYLIASGRTKALAYVNWAEVPPYLLAAWALTSHFGALGAALAWSGRLTIDSVVRFLVVRRVSTLPAVPLLELGTSTAVISVVLGCAAAACATLTSGLILRLVCAATLGVFYLIAVWRVVLTRPERAELAELATAIAPIRSVRKRYSVPPAKAL
jgi:O-antigen/teichoic acid export membrane protein